MKDAVLNRLFLRYREHGDGRALAAVFDLTAKELLAVAAHLARDAGEAEDLVQIVFLRAMERAAAFDRAQGLRPWLHGILWREALAARRRAARRLEPDALTRAGESDPAELAAERELPATVRAALEGLPRRYREVVEPLLLEEKPAHVIAAQLGRSSGTVRVQIHRGLDRLRRALPRGLSAHGVTALPTRGWSELRKSVLRTAGSSAQSAGALSTWTLATQTAFAVAPALWLVPLAAGGTALVATQPLFRPPASAPAPLLGNAKNPQETDPMKPSSLLALPVALGLSTSPAQDSPGRQPAAAESVAEKVTRLDALVGELLTISREKNEQARVAWAGLEAAGRRIELEFRERRNVEQRVARATFDAQKAWVEAASQLQDPALRARTLREIEVALLSGSPEQQLAACGALAQLREVKFDKQPFRAPVLAIAQSSSGPLRVKALYALYNTEHKPEDLALALALAEEDSSAARESGMHLLYLFSGGDLTGPAAAPALRLLQADVSRQGLSGLWGARVSPEIAAYLLEMSRSSDRDKGHDAIYYGLSTFEDKPRAVVERLIEAACSTDSENAWRSRWGLGHGVRAEDGPLVATSMQRLFEERSEPALQTELLQLIGQYGTFEQLTWLQRIEGDAAQPDSVREAAREALAGIRQR